MRCGEHIHTLVLGVISFCSCKNVASLEMVLISVPSFVKMDTPTGSHQFENEERNTSFSMTQFCAAEIHVE